jgi:hypothetical protein
MTDKQIADQNPSQGQVKAEVAFSQLPDANVKVGKITKWAGPPEPVKRDTPLIPPKLTGMIEFNGEHEVNAAKFGLYPVRITRMHGDGTPGSVVGPYGKILEHGQEYELPANVAYQLAIDKCAVFLFEGKTKEDIKFIEEAKRRGFEVHTPRPKPAAPDERPWLKRKKTWMHDPGDAKMDAALANF